MNLIDQSLGALARSIPGATRVFHEHKLDFCCGGKHSLQEAAAARGIDAQPIVERLGALLSQATREARDWRTVPAAVLIEHILFRFHDRHREQLPELVRLARRVEQVHGDRPDCPTGLADHLTVMQHELESHMQKEEQVLFPMLARGHAGALHGPVTVLRNEHDQHGEALQRLEALTDDITLPRAACNTWRALYTGLAALREDLMEHIHLENNILFEGLNAAPAGAEAAHG
ncbi:iron-sulfur cluster repair protein YtfE [Methyloversatilis sp.]|uniref:iron-sulfur cluster repair protein YtfE n=1 Tax=Methyloversatilis sp. TaxID=2569862 RepID=UPI003F720AC4